MVEQLLDLQAVAGGAVGVPAGARVHQQRHCARHLAVALIALRVRHARRGLIDLPRMRLQNCPTLTKIMAHLSVKQVMSICSASKSQKGQLQNTHDSSTTA